MPHRAGYFVLAYNWDHHCQELVESLNSRFGHIYCDIESLALPQRVSMRALREYLATWQACRKRLDNHLREMDDRSRVIDELGNRGYGTNKDLLAALRKLSSEQHSAVDHLFHERFERALPHMPKRVTIPKEAFVSRDVNAILAALGQKPGSEANRQAQSLLDSEAQESPIEDAFARYFEVMSNTPWGLNTSIFQKLFHEMGTASMTIMRGKVGLASVRTPQELKIVGNRNFVEMCRESFASLHLFSEIGLDLLKRIHWVLSKNLEPEAGNFRKIDFPDRNGVTTEFGNLSREIGNLAHVLRETGQSFHDLPRFLWDLSRSYYMFIGVHPFWDSNGRVGRTFLNHMLLKKGIPPITYRDEEEIFALPRYGGTMENMHAYLMRRIRRAMESYLHERSQLEKSGSFDKEIYNVSFDSGFHFRQINDAPQRLQACLTAYLAPDGSPEAKTLEDQCRVVLPNEQLIRNLSLYCGLADSERGEWKETLGLVSPSTPIEIASDVPGVRAFELHFELEVKKNFVEHEYLCCSAVSPQDKRVFSNKGIYYCTRIEKRSFAGLTPSGAAERFALPAYKWLGERRNVAVTPNGQVSLNSGGIGFSFLGGAGGLSLKALLELWRADGVCERYLIDAHRIADFGGDWQRWQTHRLPLTPWDGPHGHVTFANFAYLLHRENQASVSQYSYKFATFADFSNNGTDRADFADPSYKGENRYTVSQLATVDLQAAYDKVNSPEHSVDMRIVFTRGNPQSPEHPVNEIHREIDSVIEKKRKDPEGRHWIHLAIFDPDNRHVAEHLVYAKNEGVEVECIADWAAVSPLNRTDNIAKLRRAGIPVLGVVRNTPGVPEEGIGSMHTKIIIFDGEVVHSSSYNLHFHLWGGNREEVMIYRSPDIALLHENIFQSIRGGIVQPIEIDPCARFNLYYSFGYTRTKSGKFFGAQDAIVTEINKSQKSIELCMFDIGFLKGVSIDDNFETDIVSALINARNRGVRVRVLLNGQIAHTGTLPPAWDKSFRRPLKAAARKLKDAWIDVGFVYYHESIYSPLHHKFAVLDGYTTIIGSYNWYETSTISDEVITVIRNEQLARTLSDELKLIARSYRIGRE